MRTGDKRAYGWLLAAVTALGLGLRAWSLGSDLWLDEVAPLLTYGNLSAWQVVVTHVTFGNHLMNTLLVKAAIGLLGEREWVIRLPAMLWGTATIPALYWVARQVLSRRASLSAALLLSVSYHHIFFSQNSRGYSAYLFLSLVSSALLVRVLHDDSLRIRAAYVAASVANVAALLIAGFVLAAHVLVSGIVVWWLAPQGNRRTAPGKRVFGVFALIASLSILLYSAVLPTMFGMIRPVYADPASGFASLSLSLVVQHLRSLADSLGMGLVLAAVPVSLLAAVGYLSLLRRQWILTLSLTLPVVLQFVFFGVAGLTFYPRLFILGLPLAILVAVATITTAGGAVTRVLGRGTDVSRGLEMSMVALLCVGSIAILPRYYASPKQPYRASLEYVNVVRQPDAVVIVIQYAEGGVRYYGARIALDTHTEYRYVRSVRDLDEVLAEFAGRPSWLVTTFGRALRQSVPELDSRIRQDWEIDRTFRGTVGDGDISIWRQK